MKLLVFSELFYPHGGGAELATWLYSKLLAEREFDVTIITRQFPNEPSVELLFNNRIRIFRIPMRIMLESRYDTLVNVGVLASSFLRKLIESTDVIYIPCGWYSMIPIAKIHRKPVVVHLHNYSIVSSTSLMYDFVKRKVGKSSLKSFIIHEIVEKRRNIASVVFSSMLNELLGKFYTRLGTLADALIFVSNAQRNLVLSIAPNLRNKSYMIYNPIPNLPFINAERGGIGYFGGRKFIKGFYVLMRALDSLANLNRIEVYMTSISEKPKRMKTRNEIIVNFLPKLCKKDLLELFKKLSIVVIPSLIPEPLPYVLLESMLCGKLVIASNIGGIPEVVDHANLGVKLVTPGDHKEIADELDSFLKLEREEVSELGTKNREYILKKFENEKSVRSFIDILTRVC